MSKPRQFIPEIFYTCFWNLSGLCKKNQLHKGFGLPCAWGFTFNLKVVGLFRERCRNPLLPLSWSTDSNLSYMVKYVNEIGLPHLYLMWVMLCIKISLVLKFLSRAWKMIEIFSPIKRINFLACVSFIKRPNKLYVFTVIRYLTILVATFSKIASSNMFFFSKIKYFLFVNKNSTTFFV